MFNSRCLFNPTIARLATSHCRSKHDFAYTGNPYETKIHMKRKVADPSEPDFEKQECLKWADWRMLKDLKKRYSNAEHWQARNNLMSLAFCRTLPSIVREIALEERNSFPRTSSCNQLVNRCALTSRARGKLIRYRMSRIVWRENADHGLLSGWIRAKWG